MAAEAEPAHPAETEESVVSSGEPGQLLRLPAGPDLRRGLVGGGLAVLLTWRLCAARSELACCSHPAPTLCSPSSSRTALNSPTCRLVNSLRAGQRGPAGGKRWRLQHSTRWKVSSASVLQAAEQNMTVEQVGQGRPATTAVRQVEQFVERWDNWRTALAGSSHTSSSPAAISAVATTCRPALALTSTRSFLLATAHILSGPGSAHHYKIKLFHVWEEFIFHLSLF